jgi:hypothetical protein
LVDVKKALHLPDYMRIDAYYSKKEGYPVEDSPPGIIWA